MPILYSCTHNVVGHQMGSGQAAVATASHSSQHASVYVVIMLFREAHCIMFAAIHLFFDAEHMQNCGYQLQVVSSERGAICTQREGR